MYLNHFAVQRKLTHYKSTIFQYNFLKKKKVDREPLLNFSNEMDLIRFSSWKDHLSLVWKQQQKRSYNSTPGKIHDHLSKIK